MTTDDTEDRQVKLQQEGHDTAYPVTQIPAAHFLRTLAHIGHAFYMTSNAAIREASLMLPVAKGDLRQVSRVLGGWTIGEEYFPLPSSQSLHQISPFNARVDGTDYIAAHIRLFTHLRPLPPIYTVVLAEHAIPQGDQYLTFTREQRPDGVHVEVAVAVA
jgi:hypothetical protein